MIGKVITYGDNRINAIIKMQNALDEMVIDGIKPTFLFKEKLWLIRYLKKAGSNTPISRRCSEKKNENQSWNNWCFRLHWN
jgi:acetyl/propionyl-CoA carboxylase alpha subunit